MSKKVKCKVLFNSVIHKNKSLPKKALNLCADLISYRYVVIFVHDDICDPCELLFLQSANVFKSACVFIFADRHTIDDWDVTGGIILSITHFPQEVIPSFSQRPSSTCRGISIFVKLSKGGTKPNKFYPVAG